MKMTYLDSTEMDGDVTLRISKVEADEVYDRFTQATVEKLSLSFEGIKRKLLLSADNRKRLIRLSGSNFIEDWIGVSITLTVEPSKRSESGTRIAIKNTSKPLNQ